VTNRYSTARGLGVVVGCVVAAVVGLTDGISTVVRAPHGVLSPLNAVLVVLHSTAALAAVGLLAGAAQELVLAAARRRPLLVSVGRFVAGGPSRWFAPDPRGALRVLTGGVYVGAATVPVLPIALDIVTSFHSMQLAAIAIVLLFVATQVIAGLVAVVLAWPLEVLVGRAGRIASPGAALALLGVAAAVLGRHGMGSLTETLRAVDGAPAAIVAGAILADAVAIFAAGAWLERRGRPLPGGTVLAVPALCAGAFAVWAATFGTRQNVVSTIFLHSRVTGVVARALQPILPAYAAGDGGLRHGGGAAEPSPELGDGRMVEVTGPLAGKKPSFVLLSIDAVRPDHVGAYGYGRPTTPNIDRFAAGAARFTHAYCTLPRSIRSFSSIWTGRYPSHIAWGHDTQYPELLDENVTLAETLGAAGYVSAAFINADYFGRTPGFFKGFGESHAPHVLGKAVWKGNPYEEAAAVSRYLADRAGDERPFLLWVHIMEPHDPYRHWTEPREFGPAPLDHYDEEVARADDAAGRIITAALELASRRYVVVAVFADHGEAFGEHGFYHHSTDLHDEQVRVPLLVRGPGIAPGERSALVSLMDLYPTLLNYAGRPAPHPIDALSLVGVLQDPPPGAAPGAFRARLFMEVMPDGLEPGEQKALFEPPWKLILDVRRGFLQLHDLDRDPREENNRFDDEPELAARMRARLLRWVDTSAMAANRSADLVAAARLPRAPEHMDVLLHVEFGGFVEVLGCDLPTPKVRVGEVFRAVLYYRVLRRTRHAHTFQVTFLADDGGAIWEKLSLPHVPVFGHYATTEWRPGEILRDEVPLRVEREVRATGYNVRLRVRNEHTDELVPPGIEGAGGDDLVLGHVDVLP
jgi:arylsulfatase A-like enzyme